MSRCTYIAIDLKSFYASVECADRQLDPLTTNLVVADQSRTDKTICLAVSPALKACGIPGRPRLFEVMQKVRQVNAQRQRVAPQRRFAGKSANAPELAANPAFELDYIVAMPRMSRYIEVNSQIYGVYLKYVGDVLRLILICPRLTNRDMSITKNLKSPQGIGKNGRKTQNSGRFSELFRQNRPSDGVSRVFHTHGAKSCKTL